MQFWTLPIVVLAVVAATFAAPVPQDVGWEIQETAATKKLDVPTTTRDPSLPSLPTVSTHKPLPTLPTISTTSRKPLPTLKPFSPITIKPFSFETPKPFSFETLKPVSFSTLKPFSFQTLKPISFETPKPFSFQTLKPISFETPKPFSFQTLKPFSFETLKPIATSTFKPLFSTTESMTTTKAPVTQMRKVRQADGEGWEMLEEARTFDVKNVKTMDHIDDSSALIGSTPSGPGWQTMEMPAHLTTAFEEDTTMDGPGWQTMEMPEDLTTLGEDDTVEDVSGPGWQTMTTDSMEDEEEDMSAFHEDFTTVLPDHLSTIPHTHL